jgi:antitoxin ParD1/3/4
MATMQINLTPELESLVKDQVNSGRYRTAEDVVREGLRLLKERQELGKPDFMFETLDELEMKLREGIESLNRGEGIPAEVSYARVMKSLKERPRPRLSYLFQPSAT